MRNGIGTHAMGWFLVLIVVSGVAGAAEPHANSAFAPPAAKGALDAALHPIDAETLKGYVARIEQTRVFAPFEGRNDWLRAQYPAKPGTPLRGGEIVSVDMPPEELFGRSIADGATWVSLVSIVSVDAEAIRIEVDLSELASDEEVWVIDPRTPRAFGPYTAAEYGDGPHWLASVMGAEAVLMVRSPRPDIPRVRLVRFSHIFLTFREIAKTLSCNIDIDCETDPDILKAATATAIILVGGAWYCSGALINNELTAPFEPYFLTATHCICTGTQARETELYWDYRSTGCGKDDPPDLDTLPRSQGSALLAADPKHDLTLIRLDTVPDGTHGRMYLGWETRYPAVNDSVMSMHYPNATHVRVSKGQVRRVCQSANGRSKLIEVNWTEGVTEEGSSGAPLLDGDSLRIVGALSLGTTHTCGSDRSGNLDWFGSFHYFYSMVSKYIDSGNPSTDEGGDNCQQQSLCPFELAFRDAPALIEDFRALRDKGLRTSALGRRLVDAYYAMAPQLARAVGESPAVRRAFIAVTAPWARIGASLR